MNFVTLPINIGGHLWTTVASLVTEVHASFKHLAHAYFGHIAILNCIGLSLRPIEHETSELAPDVFLNRSV